MSSHYYYSVAAFICNIQITTLSTRAGHIISGTQSKMKMQSPLFKKQEKYAPKEGNLKELPPLYQDTYLQCY